MLWLASHQQHHSPMEEAATLVDQDTLPSQKPQLKPHLEGIVPAVIGTQGLLECKTCPLLLLTAGGWSKLWTWSLLLTRLQAEW